MSDVEPIVIILLTFERTDYAVRTVQAARQFLRYPVLRWYIADGGSSLDHVYAVREALSDAVICGEDSLTRRGYGESANRAIDAAEKTSKLWLFLEDDWELRSELDLRPYADLLMDDDGVGMVRMGYLQAGMLGMSFGYHGIMYWGLRRDSPDPHVFTGHPSLRHARFHQTYGKYTEGRRPGETELDMAWKFRQASTGPGIVYPVRFSEYGPFAHIGERQSYT